MSTEEAIVERLNALEKQNRWMKRIGAAVIVIAASLFLMGQKAAVNRTIEANEFVLRDSNGIVRSKWFMTKEGPVLSLLDENGNDRVTMKVFANRAPEILLSGPNDRKGTTGLHAPVLELHHGGISFQGPTSRTGPQIFLLDAGEEIELSTFKLEFLRGYEPYLSLGRFGQTGKPDVVEFQMFNSGGSMGFEASDNPRIRIEDKEGFAAAVGSTDLIAERTGETHQTSAASVILFGKDKKILWKAP